MLGLCAEHDLPRPKSRAWVAGLRVDFLFAASRLVVETDGYRTLRFTHRQLTRQPGLVAATITKVGDSVRNE